MTHAKYIDVSSPYRSQYTMSNNVSTDPNYWNMVANYLQSNGAMTDGTVGAVTYNGTTGIFSYPVSPGPDGVATVTMGLG